jgi:predicted nucleotidyltransferase
MRRRSTKTQASPRLRSLRATVLPIARAHGASNIRVFGSFARGEQRKGSDVDLLVHLPARASLLDLVGLKLDLEDALGRKVDVVPDDSIKPALRDRILSEARPL